MKNKKNSVRVSGFFPIFLFCFMLICLAVFLWFWFDGGPEQFAAEKKGYRIFLYCLIVFFLLALPIGLFLWSFFTMWRVVVIDETGLHSSLLGVFLKKDILWSDLKSVKAMSSGLPGAAITWWFFSKQDLNGKKMSQCIRTRNTIYVADSKRFRELVEEYIDLKEIAVS